MLDIGGGDDEIGLQTQDGRDVPELKPLTRGFSSAPEGLRIESSCADNLRPGAEVVENVGAIRAQGDDPLRCGSTRHSRRLYREVGAGENIILTNVGLSMGKLGVSMMKL